MTRKWRRVAAGVGTVTVVTLVVLAVWVLGRPRPPEERLAAARELVSRTTLSVAVDGSSLLAGRAIADFGVGAEVRLVRVRIADELRLSVRLASEVDLELAAAPRACLVGPYSAPDDAGLSSPCWGEPDIGALLAARLTTSPEGRPTLVGGQPVDLLADLRRGNERCDYPPGQWRLEVSLDPIVDGVPTGPVELPEVAFMIPFAADDRLVTVADSRYCGLAETIYRDQGEPAIVTPHP